MKGFRKTLALVPLEPELASLLSLLFTDPQLHKLVVRRTALLVARVVGVKLNGKPTRQQAREDQQRRLWFLLCRLASQLMQEVTPVPDRWAQIHLLRSGQVVLVCQPPRGLRLSQWCWRLADPEGGA